MTRSPIRPALRGRHMIQHPQGHGGQQGVCSGARRRPDCGCGTRCSMAGLQLARSVKSTRSKSRAASPRAAARKAQDIVRRRVRRWRAVLLALCRRSVHRGRCRALAAGAQVKPEKLLKRERVRSPGGASAPALWRDPGSATACPPEWAAAPGPGALQLRRQPPRRAICAGDLAALNRIWANPGRRRKPVQKAAVGLRRGPACRTGLVV